PEGNAERRVHGAGARRAELTQARGTWSGGTIGDGAIAHAFLSAGQAVHDLEVAVGELQRGVGPEVDDTLQFAEPDGVGQLHCLARIDETRMAPLALADELLASGQARAGLREVVNEAELVHL